MIFSEPSSPPPDLGEVHVADEAEPFPRGQQTAEGDLTQAALHPDDEAASERALGAPAFSDVFWGGAAHASLLSAKKLPVAAFPLDVLELPVIQTLSSHSASRPNCSKGPKPSIKGLEISMEPASWRPDQPRKTPTGHDIGMCILCIHKLPASSLLVTSHEGGREIFPRVANRQARQRSRGPVAGSPEIVRFSSAMSATLTVVEPMTERPCTEDARTLTSSELIMLWPGRNLSRSS